MKIMKLGVSLFHRGRGMSTTLAAAASRQNREGSVKATDEGGLGFVDKRDHKDGVPPKELADRTLKATDEEGGLGFVDKKDHKDGVPPKELSDLATDRTLKATDVGRLWFVHNKDNDDGINNHGYGFPPKDLPDPPYPDFVEPPYPEEIMQLLYKGSHRWWTSPTIGIHANTNRMPPFVHCHTNWDDTYFGGDYYHSHREG